jgi:3-deoxy-D-manno-octulosonic-acid transferase
MQRILCLWVYFIYKNVPWLCPIFLKKRLDFETGLIDHKASESWHKASKKALVAFQFSSEGEWEQVRFLVNRLLEQKHLLELVYTSPSVDKKMLSLYNQYPNQLRLLRSPVALGYYNIVSEWVTAPKWIQVRYDFFPDFLFHSKKCESYLLWAKKSKLKFFDTWVFSFYKKVMVTLPQDIPYFQEHLGIDKVNSVAVDFRVASIQDRLMTAENTLSHHLKSWTILKKFIQDQKNSTIFANAYAQEINFLVKHELYIPQIIVPHDPEGFTKAMTGDEFYFCHPLQEEFSLEKVQGRPVVLLGKGYLLELMSYMDYCFVGGGFFSQSHSLLEPIYAGCMTFCGPNVHHSTEYSYVQFTSSTQLQLLESLKDWPSSEEDIVRKGLSKNDTFLTEQVTLDYWGEFLRFAQIQNEGL